MPNNFTDSEMREEYIKKEPFTVQEQNSWNNNTHFPIDYNKEYNVIVDNLVSKTREKIGSSLPAATVKIIEEYSQKAETFLREKGKQMLNAPSPYVTGRAGYNYGRADKVRSIYEKKVSEFNKYTHETENKLTAIYQQINKNKFQSLPDDEKIQVEIDKMTKLRDRLHPTRDEWQIEQVNKKIKSLNKKKEKTKFQLSAILHLLN